MVMEGGDPRGRLRSMEPEEFQILKLKKEAKALMDRRREEQALEDRMAAAGKDRAAAAEAQPPAGKKRKKVVKTVVPQGLIDYKITNPCIPWYGFREETLPNRSQEFREYYAKRKAISDKYLEYDLTIIKQYVIKGHADDYTEVTDDEAEDI